MDIEHITAIEWLVKTGHHRPPWQRAMHTCHHHTSLPTLATGWPMADLHQLTSWAWAVKPRFNPQEHCWRALFLSFPLASHSFLIYLWEEGSSFQCDHGCWVILSIEPVIQVWLRLWVVSGGGLIWGEKGQTTSAELRGKSAKTIQWIIVIFSYEQFIEYLWRQLRPWIRKLWEKQITSQNAL